MFHKNSGIEKIYGQERGRDVGREGGREGGIISFCVKNLMAHSTEKLRRGNLLCCTKINFWYRKMFGIRGVRVSQFSVKLFCLTVPNHLVEECFILSESFGYQRNLCLRGDYHDFLWKICCLTVTTNFVGEPIRVSLNSGIEKILLEKVLSRFSIESLLSQSTDFFRKGTLL